MLVGFIAFATSYRFGVLLIVFYFSSSKLTKLKEDVKAKLEDDYQAGGQRGVVQVFSCSLLAMAVCSAYYLLLGEDSNLSFSSAPSGDTIDLPYFGPLDRGYIAMQLTAAYVAHFATANGDTWASEVGILSPSRPRLVTSLFLKEVPPGTNGGMSLMGTAASAAGGAAIGLAYWIMSFLYPGEASQLPMVGYGLLCGLLGSFVDSLLGALLQASVYSTAKQRIVKVSAAAADPTTKLICGVDLLSNEAVNVLSIAITMLLSLLLAPRML